MNLHSQQESTCLRRALNRVEVELFVRYSHFAHGKPILDKAATALRGPRQGERVANVFSQNLYIVAKYNIVFIEKRDLDGKVLGYRASQTGCHRLDYGKGEPFKLGYMQQKVACEQIGQYVDLPAGAPDYVFEFIARNRFLPSVGKLAISHPKKFRSGHPLVQFLSHPQEKERPLLLHKPTDP